SLTATIGVGGSRSPAVARTWATVSPTVAPGGMVIFNRERPRTSAYDANNRTVTVTEKAPSHERYSAGWAFCGRPERYASDNSEMSTLATIARNSFDGLKTGTGRAETSTGAPVRGLRAMRVLRWRILKVPNPRTSMLRCSCNACLIASRNESTTRAQSFLEIIGPAVRAIWVVTCSTRSALVMSGPQRRTLTSFGVIP